MRHPSTRTAPKRARDQKMIKKANYSDKKSKQPPNTMTVLITPYTECYAALLIENKQVSSLSSLRFAPKSSATFRSVSVIIVCPENPDH